MTVTPIPNLPAATVLNGTELVPLVQAGVPVRATSYQVASMLNGNPSLVLGVAAGGTGNSTLTSHAVLLGNGTSPTQDTGAGTTGQLLVGNTGAKPSWLAAGTTGQALLGATGSSPSWSTNYVPTVSFGTTGFTPSSPTSGAIVMAGTLVTGNGGTGLTTFSAANNALYSTSSSALTAGTLPSAAGGTGLTTFTAANNAIYSASASTLTAGTLPVLAGGTGVTTSTGSGNTVLSTSPALTTPTINNPTVTMLNGGQLAGMRNRIINGGMTFDQRNFAMTQTFTAGSALAYSVDRWYGYCTGANVTGAQIVSTGSAASPSRNAYRFTGAGSVTAIGFAQRIEAANSFDLAGDSATLSVNLANTLLSTVTWTAYYANTADTFGTLASPTVTQIATGTFTVNSTLTNYSTTISVPGAATTGIQILFTVGAQTSGTWTIGNVQLEPGSQATPFEARPVGTELALCQRYLPQWHDNGSGVDTISIGWATAATTGQALVSFRTTARTNPTGIVVSAGNNFNLGGLATTVVAFGSAGVDAAALTLNFASGGVAGVASNFRFNTASAYLYFTGCEL